MTEYKELTIPYDFEDVEAAIEICRVFVAKDESFVVLDSKKRGDEAEFWGSMFADIASHAINMIIQRDGLIDSAALKSEFLRGVERGYSARISEMMSYDGKLMWNRH